MKKVWIEIEHFDKSFITGAIESGVDAFFVPDETMANKIETLSKVDIYVKNTENNTNFQFLQIDSNKTLEGASKVPEETALIIEAKDWKVIPFENLLAKRGNIFAMASTVEEAVTAINILQRGTDGVYIKNCGLEPALEILKKVKDSGSEKLQLTEGTVLEIERLPYQGDRVCVDTIRMMKPGEGMLVGNFSNAMILVNSETVKNEYVSTRPFRVNAGAIHSYTYGANGRTCYLSDLKSGTPVLSVNYDGTTSITHVGRVKTERRPMLKVTLQGNQRVFSVVLQNAETVGLVGIDGSVLSVVKLEAGQKVLIYEEAQTESAEKDGGTGRHFGYKVKEWIEEK